MNRKKVAAASLGVLSACSLLGSIITYAVNNDAVQKDASLQNGFISLTVEQDKEQLEYLKFRLDTTEGQLRNDADNDKNITYRNFFSGYTTINIDGTNYIYGQGEDVSDPKYDVANKCHISSQKFGDVVIQQKLTFAEGYTVGYEDMLEISYKILQSSPENAVGVRVLLDPMIGDDDMLSLSVNNVMVNNESLFNQDIPKDWKAEMRSDGEAAAYGKLSGADPQVSSVLFANWNSVYDVPWDYKPDISNVITDASAAIIWEPVTNAVGKEFKTYYGVKNNANTGASNDANLSSPKTGSPFPAIAVSLFAVSAVSAGACLILARKEKKNAES